MNKIALKTAKRSTSITREAVREAVNGVFTGGKISNSGTKDVSKRTIRKSKKH
jgi:hypothetical protein